MKLIPLVAAILAAGCATTTKVIELSSRYGCSGFEAVPATGFVKVTGHRLPKGNFLAYSAPDEDLYLNTQQIVATRPFRNFIGNTNEQTEVYAVGPDGEDICFFVYNTAVSKVLAEIQTANKAIDGD